MALPSTGGTWAQVVAPNLNPLDVRYGQIVDIFIRDYLDASGNPRNLADPACGLGTQGVFSPFAADGLTIRKDLLWNAAGSNQGWFPVGLLKEDATSISPDQTVQQTPTAQYIRTVRNVFTKLEDKIAFTPIQNSNLVKRLRFELPLTGWTPDDGTTGYQLVRSNSDILRERQLIVFLIDGDDQLQADVFPRIATDKKGKLELGRKMPYSSELNWDVLPDPYSQSPMWTCEAGTAFLAEGNFAFATSTPGVTPITGLKATVVVPTPTDVTSPTYTVAIQTTPGGSFSAGTISTPAPSVTGAFTTITIGSLIASTTYNALRITASGGGVTVTTPSSAPFTATSS